MSDESNEARYRKALGGAPAKVCSNCGRPNTFDYDDFVQFAKTHTAKEQLDYANDKLWCAECEKNLSNPYLMFDYFVKMQANGWTGPPDHSRPAEVAEQEAKMKKKIETMVAEMKVRIERLTHREP